MSDAVDRLGVGGEQGDAGWRFGRQQAVPLAWLFDLRRNVSITPRQLMGCYALLCALSLLVAAGIAGGLWQLQVRDDLRSLQSSPPALMAQQIRLSQLLGMPSPAQFYLVRAPDAETLLQREQALATIKRTRESAIVDVQQDEVFVSYPAATFPVRGVIACWTEGLQKIRVGGKATLTCPPATATRAGPAPP